jgi:putative membrane protein
MMWGYTDGWSMVWMGGMMVLFWGGIIALVVFAVRAFAGPRGTDQAVDVLRRRLASGEISQEDYEKTRKALQG